LRRLDSRQMPTSNARSVRSSSQSIGSSAKVTGRTVTRLDGGGVTYISSCMMFSSRAWSSSTHSPMARSVVVTCDAGSERDLLA
jgi:hypothetical protein